jgi:sigma-54 dependent transcriptional regulator, acetoin dehydrogenase operon transcriptional activator AcoR
MKKLIDIKEYVQNIADVIQSVVDVDVTIIDSDNFRIAATGKYCDKIGQKGGERSVFLKAMISKKSYIINNPKYEAVCIDCGNREECIEFAEVCSPIILGENVIGVIGLVALSEKQRDNLIKNSDNLLNFLKKMGDLLGSKLTETEIIEKEKIIHKQIETIIDSVDDGIIAIDEMRNVLYTNKVIKKLETRVQENLLINEILNGINIAAIIHNKREIKNKQLILKDLSFLYSVKAIELENKIIGFVILIRTIKDINRIINDVSTPHINTSFADIIGESNQLNYLKDLSLKACKGDSTILITGESGTGKEMFARAIHYNGNRKDKPFIAINCAAIPENLLESELFGYEEGSFTGAKKGGKIGKFELGNGGTIFLDEIGDMPLHLQTKLLRVIQERSIERIGSIYNTKIDIRIIAATHKDLDKMVEQGEFRRDLFYRLNVIPLKIPPLRDRTGDIDILIYYFLNKCNSKLEKSVLGFSEEVVDLFNVYYWPGNIREMENVIEYAVNMESTEIISMNNLPARFKERKKCETAYNLRILEKQTIEAVLAQYPNRDKAAAILGVGRATLFRKIKEYEIEVSK